MKNSLSFFSLSFLRVGTAILALTFLLSSQPVKAQGPDGRSFGFGLILGDPYGLTLKFWTDYEGAFDVDFGYSYFGPLRLQGDYLWHFNAFRSDIVRMYAGPGLALAFGNGSAYYGDHDLVYNGIGVGARVIFGVDVIPRRTPIEIFLELGPLIAFVPGVGVGLDAGVGIRFYP
jgi:hypothetical protein